MLPLLLDGKKLQQYQKQLKYILEVAGLSDKRKHPPDNCQEGNNSALQFCIDLCFIRHSLTLDSVV